MSGTDRVVAVTGLGLMTGLGLDLESSWTNLLAGERPARPFSLFDATTVETGFGVQLPEGAEGLFASSIRPRLREQMTRGTMIAVLTADMAVKDAGLDWAAVDRGRVGVVAGGTGTGYVPPSSAEDPHRILRNMASAPAAWISLRMKLQGPSEVVSTACASGAYALYAAASLILDGSCDVVIAGAADSSVNAVDVRGFGALMALSDRADDIPGASRPFDARRNGFVMGEGGGMLVLESVAFARRRGARVHALLPLPGLCSEAYNILSPDPEGRGMARAMELALRQAGLRPDQIDYVNAHGTSTPLNDLCETRAIKAVFGDHAYRLPISSTKSQTGHCLSAAAGVEAVIACRALAEGVIPATQNLDTPDPELDLDYVPGSPRRLPLRHVMSNSFAFGGQNGVCIFSRES